MPPEAHLEPTVHGLVPNADGWFVLNGRDARWLHAEGRGAWCDYEGDVDFPQLGINVQVLHPGDVMSMYHWEADQEDFVVVSGEALLIVEGEERRLRTWDLFHCPAGTKHTIVGAGGGPCVVVAAGAREHSGSPDWGAYVVDETAIRHRAGVESETSDPQVAYGSARRRDRQPYREGWLPD